MREKKSSASVPDRFPRQSSAIHVGQWRTQRRNCHVWKPCAPRWSIHWRTPWVIGKGRKLCLHLLGSPAGVGFAHVGGRLDLGNELENDVSQTDEADDRAGNDAKDLGIEEDGADEDVN